MTYKTRSPKDNLKIPTVKDYYDVNKYNVIIVSPKIVI